MFGRKKPAKGGRGSKPRGSGGAAAPAVDLASIEAAFERLHDAEEEAIGIDGIETMGEEMGTDVGDDIAILVFAWKCECKKGLHFSREEFVRGMTAVGCSSIPELAAKLPALRESPYRSPAAFKDFYKASFRLSCDDNEKTLSGEVASMLLTMIIRDPSAFPHLADFQLFISTSDSVRRISFDVWCQYLVFSETIAADVSDFDEDGAWPEVFDDFVEWKREKMSKK